MADSGVIIGLDIGRRLTGIARADRTLTLASPVAAIETEPVKSFPHRLTELLAPESILGIVAGLPLDLKGMEGDSARFARIVADEISNCLDISVDFIDERFTTRQMDSNLHEAGSSWKKRKERIDMWAAASILQTWLEQQNLQP